jgi:hypothetical protein
MKTRNALVSNSSSASFICYWRCLKINNGETMPKKEAIKELTREWNDDDHLLEITKELIKNTEDTSSAGTFKTTGFTSMYNDITDIPSFITHLVVGLKLEPGYELIDLHVDDDGGF